MSFSTPVVLIIFNRPDLTQIVFNAIAEAKPRQLLVIADGPRPERPGEAEKCEQARAILQQVNWDCEVRTNFSDENMGCKKRVSSGLNWVFDQVKEAIILEDDCLPSQSFFSYCQTLLEYYRDDVRIASINGCNLGYSDYKDKHSYRFSRYMNMWGWATWRRTCLSVDFEMSNWAEVKTSPQLKQSLGKDYRWYNYWLSNFERTHSGEIDTWDYQWILSNLCHNQLAVSPSVNLVKNLGYGEGATHTKDAGHDLAKLSAQEIPFPLIHPRDIQAAAKYDEFIKGAWCGIFPEKPLPVRAALKVRTLMKNAFQY